jgi:hypothetical protein
MHSSSKRERHGMLRTPLRRGRGSIDCWWTRRPPPRSTRYAKPIVSKRVGNYVFNPEFGVLLDQLWVR